MNLTYIFFGTWLFLFQHLYDAIFATKNKRVMQCTNLGMLLDFSIFQVSWVYIIIVYKDFRFDTFLRDLNPYEEATAYWINYINSPVNENVLLVVFMTFLWLKAFYQLKLFQLFASLFAILEKLVTEVIIFGIFYFAQLFLFAVVGVVLFPDLSGFAKLQTSLFTLFKASIGDYDID